MDGPDTVMREVDGHKFGQNDDGAAMMCSLVCRALGRHPHNADCHANDAASCTHPEVQHIEEMIYPNPDTPKDWITHALYWHRSGIYASHSLDGLTSLAFSQDSKVCIERISHRLPLKLHFPDPYSKDEQADFAKWLGALVCM